MSTQFTDRTLTCSDCSQEFIFEAGEAAYFANKGFEHPPRRCKPCREINKIKLAKEGKLKPRPGHTEITCSDCGVSATVPFVPAPDRDVYCFPCLKGRQR